MTIHLFMMVGELHSDTSGLIAHEMRKRHAGDILRLELNIDSVDGLDDGEGLVEAVHAAHLDGDMMQSDVRGSVELHGGFDLGLPKGEEGVAVG